MERACWPLINVLITILSALLAIVVSLSHSTRLTHALGLEPGETLIAEHPD